MKQREIIDYIVSKLDKPLYPERPDGFGVTTLELAREKGISRYKAREILEQLVKTGDLVKIMMLDHKVHTRVAVYVPPKLAEKAGFVVE